jgi:hypothetical protein
MGITRCAAHSITSSASASIVGGTLRPSAFAGEAPGSLGIAPSPAFVDLQIAARLPAQLFEPLIERHQPTFGLGIVRDAHQNANALHSLELLRAPRAATPQPRRRAA